MKYFLLLFLAFTTYTVSLSQVQITQEPVSSAHLILSPEFQVKELTKPDMQKIIAEDIEDEKNGALEKFSRLLPVNINLRNSGTWEELQNGDKIWRLKIVAPEALATFAYYDEFYLPDGAKFFVYSENKREVLGAFTSHNNNDLRTFMTGIIHGESCIFEYFEPAEVAGEGVIKISEIAYAYRHIYPIDNQLDRGSDTCEVDINCMEGDEWRNQQKGVVRILVKEGGASGWCSGSVVNNTSEDCKPYVLTAYHCGTNASASDFNQWLFYFNYEKANCGSGITGALQTVTGASMIANSGDGGGNSGSDFLLVELNNEIPWHYDPYFNGWDVSGVASISGVSIHHPSGDVKKISTYTTALLSSTWGGTPNTHWRVKWSATTNGHGVTEGGSSGSPIFSSDKRIIGQLTGGSSYCTQPNSPDYYGKMSYNWTSNPGDDLKTYLDPNNTGALFMDGRYYSCANNIKEVEWREQVKIYPNPANEQLTIILPDLKEGKITLTLYNMLGERMKKVDAGNISSEYKMNVSDVPAGIYLLSLSQEGINEKYTVRLTIQ